MKKIILLIFGISMFAYSCDTIDFGDTNENVNGPNVIKTSSMLSGAMTNFMTRTGRSYRVTPTLYAQYFIQYVYNTEMLYAEAPGYWGSYYSGTATNCQEVINFCSNPENETVMEIDNNGAFVNQIAVARIFKAVIFKRITDLFGDVPYFGIYDTENLYPAYDKQEDIYRDMIKEVKEARDMIDESQSGPHITAFYGSDMTLWKKFANSFLLSLSMQLSKVDPAYAEQEFTAALNDPAGVIEDVSEDAVFVYDVTNGYNNPWSWLRKADYGLSAEFVGHFFGNESSATSNTTTDYRYYAFAYDRDWGALGEPYGYDSYSQANACHISGILRSSSTDLPLLTSSYVWLQRAEAAALGWTTDDVATCLTNGIQNSYARLSLTQGMDFGDGATYAAARVADMATYSPLQVIGEEKWVALCPQGFDAWAEWRRTGWPALSPAPDALNDGNIPTRYNYPSEEPNINSSNYNTGVSGLTPADDKNTSKVWWDVD